MAVEGGYRNRGITFSLNSFMERVACSLEISPLWVSIRLLMPQSLLSALAASTRILDVMRMVGLCSGPVALSISPPR